MNVTKEFKVKYTEQKQRKSTWSSSSSSPSHIQWMYTHTHDLFYFEDGLSRVLLSQWEHWQKSRATAKIVLLIIFMAVDCCVYFSVFLLRCLCLNVRHAIRWIGPLVVRQCFPLHRLVLPFSYCNCTRDVVNVLSDFHSSHFTWRIASFFSSNFFFRFAVCDAIARKQLLRWKQEMKE